MVPFWYLGGEEAGREGKVRENGVREENKVERKQITTGSTKSQPHNTALFMAPCLLAERTLIPFKNQSSPLLTMPEMPFSCHQYFPQRRSFSFPLGELREECLNLDLLSEL